MNNVQVNDGTTSNVETSTGEITHLLSVDETSYEYWLNIPAPGNRFERVDPVSGDTIGYTLTENAAAGTVTINWTKNGQN